MRSMLVYSGLAGSVGLDGPLAYTQGALGLRGREWSYDLGARALRSAVRKARTAEVDAVFVDDAEADRARHVFEADVAAGSPGRLVVGGEWEQRAYVVKAEAKGYRPGLVQQGLTVALLDGCWSRLVVRPYRMRDASAGQTWLDLPTDLPTGLGRSLPPEELAVDGYAPMDVRLTVYGPATSPYVVVGGNRYQVSCDVPDGARLVVDGRDKTVELVGADGTRESRFSSGVRDGGEGGGSYVFERVEPSPVPLAVSWDNSFGFDLGYYQVEGEPPWTA